MCNYLTKVYIFAPPACVDAGFYITNNYCMRKIITLVFLCVLPLTYMAAEGYQVNSQSAKQSGM